MANPPRKAPVSRKKAPRPAVSRAPRRDEAATAPPARWVAGVVKSDDGDPVAATIVRAFDAGLRKQAALGESLTDEDGRYRISYERQRLLDPARGAANLIVETGEAKGLSPARSAVWFGAAGHEQINLVMARDPQLSEWERVDSQLQTALDGVGLDELDAGERGFVARASRVPPPLLERRVRAAAAARKTQLPPWFHYVMESGAGGRRPGAWRTTSVERLRQVVAAAAEKGTIPRPSENEAAALFSRVEHLQRERLLDRKLVGRSLTARELLNAAGMKVDAHPKLAEVIATVDLKASGGWDALSTKLKLEPAAIDRLRLVSTIADLAGEHRAIMAAVAGDGRLRDTRDLARHFDEDEWRAVLARTTGTKEADPQQARELAAKTAALHPTLAATYGLARRLEPEAHPALPIVQKMADDDPGFDLGTVRLGAKLTEQIRAHARTESEQAEIAGDLMRLQRVYRINRAPAVMAALLEDRLDSSAAIVQKGKRSFLAKYGHADRLGKEQAEAAYKQAEVNAASAFALYAHFSPWVNTTATPAAIGGDCPPELRALPHYAELFGTLDGCECEPCESVYSPAAYLTDILHFLKIAVVKDDEHPNAARVEDNGLAALEERAFCDGSGKVHTRPRRPDIARTLLSCRNAETLVPYVDLVLEILENTVAPAGGVTLQTTLDADQLAAQPEHQNSAAYEKLATAVFPLGLPFDLWHEEAGIYLSQLGTTRSELVETFYPIDPDNIRRFQDVNVARARLGLSPRQWQLIANRPLTPLVLPAAMWGFPVSSNWWAPLEKVSVFLDRSGLDFKDLLRLLKLESFNPGGSITINPADALACDPATIEIKNLDANALGYLHRFLRLQRLLGLSWVDLDVALRGLGIVDGDGRRAIDEAFLVRLSNALRLRDLTGRPLDEVVACWSAIDTADRSVQQLNHDAPIRSLYDRLFQSGRAGEGDFDTFKLNGARTELATTTEPIVDHMPAVAAAIGLPPNAAAELAHGLLAGGATLDSATLSMLFRHALLARALALPVADYLALKTLIGFDPFLPATVGGVSLDGPTQTMRFIVAASAAGAAGATIAELDFLLRQTMPFDGPTVAPTLAWIDEQIGTLAQNVQTPDPLEAVRAVTASVRATAAAAPVSDAAALVLAVDLQGARDSLAALGDGLDTAALAVRLDAAGTALRQQPLDHAAIAAALDALHAELVSLAAAFVETTLRPQLTHALASTLDVGAGIAAILMARVVFPADPSQRAGQVLLDALRVPSAGAPPISADSLRELLYRLVKTARIIGAFGLRGGELVRIIEVPVARGWLDLSALPVRAGDPPAPYESWARLASLVQLLDALADDQREAVFALFDAAGQFAAGAGVSPGNARREYLATLKVITGWPTLDIDALVGRFSLAEMPDGGGGVLKPQFPQHFADEKLPLRVLAGIRLGQRIGVPAIECSGWLAVSPASAERRARSIKDTLRSRYGAEWPGVQKTLRDPLRERQRAALVAHLVQAWSVERADDLFDHFLIDVEMSPCMMTSRLIQATAAVQLFVQRVQLNLEPGLMLPPEAAEQWEWMKNYRVWEANRKIFLYPENWIEPDLRDDKTPFFEELERELRQARITNESAESALLHYLERLHEVARLQICGQYVEEGFPKSTIHVFGRTRETPNHYYYRRGELEFDAEALSAGSFSASSVSAEWTPWRRVDVDIEGHHLIPFVHNRRVYLFWPIFMSEDEAPMAHTMQSILSVYGQMFKLLQSMGSLVQAVAKSLGVTVVGAAANSVIQVLYGLENTIDIGGTDIVNLRPMRNDVRDLRTALLGMFGVPASASSDDTARLVANAAAPDFAALGSVFTSVTDLVSNYEQYFLSFLPAKLLKVQLAWSEYRGDNWTAKRTSNGAVSFRDLLSLLFENLPNLPGLSRDGVRRLFTFRGAIEDGELIIHCGVAMPDSLLNPETLEVLGESAVTAMTDDDPTTNRPAWLSAPLEIGRFRVNTCAGEVEALDAGEQVGFGALFGQLFDSLLSAADEVVGVFQGDRQLTQVGAPVTPDDDPDRPSLFRRQLEEVPLPQHYRGSAPATRDVYRILARHQSTSLLRKSLGFFYQDAKRTFFCFPWPLGKKGSFGFVFFPFYHPYTCALIEQLQRGGIPGIYEDRYRLAGNGRLQLSDQGEQLQVVLQDEDYFAPPEYDPVDKVATDGAAPRPFRPIEEITFSTVAAYGDYNWEIFFHAPLLIATRLSADQQFRDAQRWFHYIFNPTDASRGSVPAKYWRTRPFVERSAADYAAEQIDDLLLVLNTEAAQDGLQELEWAVRKWRRDAFNPHLVARTRTVAFQKAVVMKYIDNLVAWGDSLFRQETRESVNEALQLYVLAAKLLGPRPRRIPRSAARPERTFRDLEPTLDAFSNALVEFENYQQQTSPPWPGGLLPFDLGGRALRDRLSGVPVGDAWQQLVKSPSLQNVVKGGGALYFCVPPNEQLLAKWDLVADRLFKIRHCQNIEGRALQLPLLSPPIDPGVLVRAKALGVDIDDLIGDIYGPPARYRFNVVLQKAVELCAEVKSLGGALLSAIEKRDGEALSLLRNTHEARVLAAVRGVKELQIEESGRTIEGLRRSQESAAIRAAHYQRLLGEFISPEESVHLLVGMVGLQLQTMQFGAKMAAAAASLVPNFKGGFVTTLGAMFGGDNIGFAAERAADGLGHLAGLLSSVGGLVQTMGGYRRRAEDWLLQTQVATTEHRGLTQQIAAAELRRDMASLDLANQQLQIENNSEMQDAMQAKFSNHDLYDWMVSRVATLHFQGYQMAYDMARQAERSFVAELGGPEPGLIRPDNWDSLKRGLLAGEYLHQDLKRLEVAYLARNVREYEMTKHVNISAVNPVALLELRATGRCTISLPESLFDMDGPGHYFRRIKSVAVSLPCVAGPYTSVNCTLTLLKSGTRTSSIVSGPFAPQTADRDEFQSIVTSSAQNDSGLLETSLRDERYLPFENAGVISEWRLELPADPSLGDPRQFDYETITDVVLHIRYTARDGGNVLRKAAAGHLKALVDSASATGCVRLFSARHDFPTEWARFKATVPAANQRHELVLPIRAEHFPFWSSGRLNTVSDVALLARSTAAVTVYDRADMSDPSPRKEQAGPAPFGGLVQARFSGSAPGMPLPASPVGEMKLYFDDHAATDMWLVMTWSGA